MLVEILGVGCPKCKKLTENAEAAVKALGLDCQVVKITDLKQIMDRGIMLTPGLSVDGVVKSAGKVLSVDDIKKLLQ